MLNRLIQWSLDNRLAVVVVSLILLGVGGYVTTTMPVDVFPDLTAPTVTVLVEGRGMAAEEMETLVTFPLESALNGAAGVRRVRSATAIGIAVIWIEFEWGTDIYRARQTVTERLAGVADALPEQVDSPALAPISSIMGEIMFVSLTSDRHDSIELQTVASRDIRRRLLAEPGVSQVTIIGGDTKQYQVMLDPAALWSHGISLVEVAEALRDGNENVSAGFLNEGGQEFVVQGRGRVEQLEDIWETVVAVRDGVPIRVREVGTVQIGPALKRGDAASSWRDDDWQPIHRRGVVFAIQKQPAANTLELTGRLDKSLDDIQAGLPEGMTLNADLFRQARFIETSIDNTIEALRDGAILVIVVALVFLGSMRPSLITISAIPVSLVVSVLVLKAFGASINTMTLGGMAIAVGMLVDDAIIDVENIVRRLRENAARPLADQRNVLDVVYRASVEVRGAIVFATLIIVLVFCPLFFLTGVEGRLLQPLGVAFVVALVSSLMVALTLTPAMSYYLLTKQGGGQEQREPAAVRLCKQIYHPPLDLALRNPLLVTVPSVALFVIAIVFGMRAGRDFLPSFNEGALVVGIVTLPGTSLEQSDQLAQIVQERLMRQPEVVAIGRRTGRAEQDEHVQGVEASEIDLTIDMAAPSRMGKPVRTRADLLAALRADIEAVPGIQATFGQPISHRIDHMLSGTRASIAIKIFGDDLDRLRETAGDIERAIENIEGVVDLSTEQQMRVPTWRVDYDRPAMARNGLHARDLSQVLSAAGRGFSVGEVFEGRIAYDLMMRLNDANALSTEELHNLPLDTSDGAKVPLRSVANIYEDTSPNFISRENVRRKIVVMCNVSGRDVLGVVDDIQAAVQQDVSLPTGYSIEYGGQFESAVETNRRLGYLTIVVIVMIGFLLHVALGSGRDALLVMTNLPLALIGGVLGVYLAGGVITVASLIGFVSVFGIAVRNGILIVSHIRHLREEEGVTELRDAVHQGASERVAPILMTALSSSLALIPLAMGADQPGKEILHPMAMVILFGLMSATFLNLIVIPAMYLKVTR